VVAESSRIEELRRRVERDPASIAFAQLAEEYRRAGELDEAVRVAGAGLERHPDYLSARVTLGRALIALGRFDEAEPELESVVRAAPDNLAAIRALAEIHQHRDEQGSGPPIAHETTPAPDPAPLADEGSFERALAALDALTLDATRPARAHVAVDPVLRALEAWHAAILRDRELRVVSR
jgi:tetratricopeptide (TPR) repeat protein